MTTNSSPRVLLRRLLVTLPLVALTLAALPRPAAGQEAGDKLVPGQPAPTLNVDEWVSGEALSFEPGQIYVVEFWATWCGPCKESIPHLNELSREFAERDVHFVGVTQEDAPTVLAFQEDEAPPEPIEYAIASDPDGSMEKGWMKAAGRSGIPVAFIVGKSGNVEWIGHPSRMDHALEAIVDGTWDPKLVASHDQLGNEYVEAMKQEQWDKALTLVDELLELHAETSVLGSPIRHESQRASLLLHHFEPERAYSYIKLVASRYEEDANLLNNLAWSIVDDEGIEYRNLDIAMLMSVQSNELTSYERPAYLDTLARVHFEKGDAQAALRWQEKAVAALPERANARMAEDLKKALERYRTAAE